AQQPADTFRETQQRPLDRDEVERVAAEGVFMPDRLRCHLGLDGVLVDPLSALPDRTPVLAKARLEPGDVRLREVADGAQAPAFEQLARLRPHPPQALELEWGEEGGLLADGHDHESVRLTQVGSDLRAELVRRDAYRQHEPALRAHVGLEVARDL